MSNSNGYLSRNLLNELDKEEKEKTTTQIVDNWQKLTASQRTAQKEDSEKKHAQNTTARTTRGTERSSTDKSSQKNNLGPYNAESVLSLGKGPIRTAEVDRLIQSGQATATARNGQVYVSPKTTAVSPPLTPTWPVAAKPANTIMRSSGSDMFGSTGSFGEDSLEKIAKSGNLDMYHQNEPPAGSEKFSASKLTEGIVRKGTTNAAHGMSSTLSWLEGALFALPEALTGFDDLQERHGLFYNWNSAIEKERENAYRNSAANIKAGGTAAKVADTIGTGFVAALPQAITAFMSAGASLGAVGAQGLEATAVTAQQSPGILNSLRSAVTGLANNPNYWTSFLRTAGESYEQAKSDGASDSKASLYAMGNGLFNAAVEVGGGLETLPKELQSGPSAFGKWIWSSAQEGAEEPIQGVIERGLQKVVYGKKNPLVSASDETAVFNPATAAKEFGVGAAVGGILGGGQTAAAGAKDRLALWPQGAYNNAKRMEGTGYGNQRGEQGGTLRETAQAAARGNAGSLSENGNRPGISGEVRADWGNVREKLGDLWQRHGGLSVAQESRRTLAEYNVGTHIIPESEWSRQDSAYTRNAEVYMRETIPEENRGMIAPHEGTHVMKQAGYQPYLDFVETVPSMLDLGSEEARVLLSKISARRGIDPFNATEAELTTFYDELNATLYGHIASGKMPQYLREGFNSAFYDFDSYAADLAAIHEGYINSRYRSNVQKPITLPSPNAARSFAGTPHDYAALLRSLAESRVGLPMLTPEQEKLLETWNQLFPEMSMTADEFLAR